MISSKLQHSIYLLELFANVDPFYNLIKVIINGFHIFNQFDRVGSLTLISIHCSGDTTLTPQTHTPRTLTPQDIYPLRHLPPSLPPATLSPQTITPVIITPCDRNTLRQLPPPPPPILHLHLNFILNLMLSILRHF